MLANPAVGMCLCPLMANRQSGPRVRTASETSCEVPGTNMHDGLSDSWVMLWLKAPWKKTPDSKIDESLLH